MWRFNEQVKKRLKLDEVSVKRIEKIMCHHSDNRPFVWCDYCRVLNHAEETECKGCGRTMWYSAKTAKR